MDYVTNTGRKRCCRSKSWVLAAVGLLNEEHHCEKTHANSGPLKNLMQLQQYCKQFQGLQWTTGENCFCLFKMLHFGFGQISNFTTAGLNL